MCFSSSNEKKLFFFFIIAYDFENEDLRAQMREQIFINFLWVADFEKDFVAFFSEIPRTLQDMKNERQR